MQAAAPLLEWPGRLLQRVCLPIASCMLLCLSGVAHMRCHELQVFWCVGKRVSLCHELWPVGPPEAQGGHGSQRD
jgi:hypothetical protein